MGIEHNISFIRPEAYISASPAQLEHAALLITQQPQNELNTEFEKYYMIVEKKPAHPFFHSPCFGSGCISCAIFGSFGAPLIKTSLDNLAAVALGKFFGGAIAGACVGTAVFYGVYKGYYYFFPDKLSVVKKRPNTA